MSANDGGVVSNERLAALLDEYADLEKQMALAGIIGQLAFAVVEETPR